MQHNDIAAEIAKGLEAPGGLEIDLVSRPDAQELPSAFPVSDLAFASVSAAGSALSKFCEEALARPYAHAVDPSLVDGWFGMTLRAKGWEIPSAFDAITGDYRAGDGWIRLHTIADHHRAGALRVLDCEADREAVASAVSGWEAGELEAAIQAEGGAAAAMRGLDAWRSHPAGMAVAAEPLVRWAGRPAQRGANLPHNPVRPLEGLKVLDCTRVLAGPVSTRFLAAWGASVLRIDPPSWEEPGLVPEVCVGKRCAGLDLRRDQDRARFTGLLREADLFVHGYRPGAIEGLGFGEEARRSLNPDLMEVSLSAYGHSGPWAGRRGFDSLVQMSCGIAEHGMRAAGSEKPFPLPVQALDHATGYLMAAAALQALRARRQGTILTAKLSLARTACLLTPFARSEITGEGHGALPTVDEPTFWGAAERLRFPVSLNGAEPSWPVEAGPLRRHEPAFSP
ncbi:CoA transferase [Parvularcula maris]|uniref:CoA transferase n=1 Tax=Parvularcula maris TaxID=2965077 RepID=A0A9X2L6F1_9PROT|nr:CoA transferase [Parvularcula maris]MCQ8183938.1 CoA transferase [Parvularcula maris]